MVKERQINPRSLENLKLGKAAGDKKKVRFNTTLLPETITWLKACGNASDTIDALVKKLSNGSFKSDAVQHDSESDNAHNETIHQVEVLRGQTEQLELQLAAKEAELNQLRQELAACQASQPQQPNLEELRDRVLAELKLGRQAPAYKGAVKALNRFVSYL
jgi:ribosomal protein L29